MNINIRRVYLYLTSLIGLILVLIGGVQILNLGLKTWIFTKADDQSFYACQRPVPIEGSKPMQAFDETACKKEQEEQRSARRQNQAASAIAMILVGAPVWLYHWKKVKDEKGE